jgi:glycosyltransferase
MVDNTNSAKYGIGTYVNQLIKCFDPTEYCVNVVELFSHIRKYERQESEGVIYHKIPFPEKHHTGNWDKSLNHKYLKSVFYLLASHIPKDSDVYCHSNFPYYSDLFLLFRERFNAKIVLTVHYMGWSFSLLGDKEKLKQITAQNPQNDTEKHILHEFETERNMMEISDAVIAIAKHSYETIDALYGIPKGKIVLITNALSDPVAVQIGEKSEIRRRYGFSEDEKIIFFAGRLDPVKGIYELIEAFKLLQSTSPNARLIVAGDGGFKKIFENLNPYWSKVVLTGFIPREQLFELYHAADLGVVPSLHEEFGYVALEMIQNGLKVLVNNTTGLKEMAEKYSQIATIDLNGKLFSEKDEILKDAIEKIINLRYETITQDSLPVWEEHEFEYFQRKIKLLYQEL